MTEIMICNQPVSVLEYAGQRVVTLAMVDAVHQRPEGTARKRFNDNKRHLEVGVDFWEISQPSEIRTLGLAREDGGTPAKVILISESGYPMLVKSFTDDLAWQVQRQLVNGYFRKAEKVQPADPMILLNDPAAMRAALLGYTEKVIALESVNAELAPKAAAHDHFAELPGELGVRDAGRELKVGQTWVCDYIDSHGWSCVEGKKRKPAHYGLQKGYVRFVRKTYSHPHTGEEMVKEEFRITQKGMNRLAEIIAGKKKASQPSVRIVQSGKSALVPFSRPKEAAS
ncbi:phage antirepressor KilAC domain-containing protein [Asaia spathodeae]|uniref:phage antirepressor KilAC domain-containing protein n=1 Tax=Asaia spathodeae TaxID=657016 RepID=UPI002FC2E3F0